jgi:hypothetical protein
LTAPKSIQSPGAAPLASDRSRSKRNKDSTQARPQVCGEKRAREPSHKARPGSVKAQAEERKRNKQEEVRAPSPPYQPDTSRLSPRTKRIRHVPFPVPTGHVSSSPLPQVMRAIGDAPVTERVILHKASLSRFTRLPPPRPAAPLT